ncbi:thioredoxin domain-containing protein [Halopseudomonas pachastrellae]|nr:thioredoxin domain-containing protein [Halopseudomonas pachastrellae]
MLTFYADLECPFCKDYYPGLKSWIGQQADVSLQWHHLPLAAHEPVASALASMAECAGRNRRAWCVLRCHRLAVPAHTQRRPGAPRGRRFPGLTPALRDCLDSERPQAVVRTQAEQGTHAGITATPSLRLEDRQSGRRCCCRGRSRAMRYCPRWIC